jgi:hypothetical protein
MIMLLVIFALSNRKVLIKGSDILNSHANHSNIFTGKATDTYTCTAVEADLTGCGDSYTAANNALTAATGYAESGAQTAVNAFIEACKTSKCLPGCPAAASGQNLAIQPTAPAAFTTACNPAPVSTKALTDQVCVADAKDKDDTCATAYQTLLTKIPTSTTALWDFTAVKTATDDFSAQCTKTACSPDCKAAIDNKNLKVVYPTLRTTFTTSCKPADSGTDSGSGDNGAFLSIEKNGLLSLLLMSLLGAELLNFF